MMKPETNPSDASGTASNANSCAQGTSSPSAQSATAAGSSDPAAAGSSEGDAVVVDGEPVMEEPVADELVAQAQAEAADWKDKYVRLHAEWDTYRRRTNEQRAEERVLATQKLVEGLLPVLDDFERTIEYAQKGDGDTAGLLSGVEAVQAKLLSVLEKDGLQVINPEGEAYDALEAQAVATVDDASVPDESVAQVYQKGYRMGSKVLRPAMVSVTTGGPKREKPAEDAADTSDGSDATK